ncbi:hypothetical protein O1611_g5660 [Lasiodiplodia mahajangana]|uniref:Uncharacterized protein n=1 Tax=Lasiodiplodia mahajangana TaxID=1108764 RepID=A0ACC2JKJ7_9PEZI|nr:hypothetical protein O1611_g5660 [Lasiodiplodia mahajangana]
MSRIYFRSQNVVLLVSSYREPNPILLSRANYNNDGQGAMPFACHDETIISVPKQHYEDLVLLSRQFANLKRSLLGAGVTEESIATLVQDTTDVLPTTTQLHDHNRSDDVGTRPKQAEVPTSTFQTASYTTYGPTADNYPGNVSYFNGGPRTYALVEENHDWSSHEQLGGTFTPSHSADGPMDVHIDSFQSTQKPRPLYARMCKRTIALSGLPPFTTLGDVTGIVRGGQLLDVFLRSAEHTASVSFVREEDAARFYEHSRKNDIYIKNKRVFIKWADRHFILPGHVASKIAAGASRNLIIRRCGAHHTEDSVREDLEHIHNLIVVKVEFVGGSCYIKTNSVHNAMFARTCMMSRAKYKGSKIEWDIDECDHPFEVVEKASAKPLPPRGPSTKSTMTGTRNRFDMLRIDDDDNNESDDKFDTSSEMPSTVDVAA